MENDKVLDELNSLISDFKEFKENCVKNDEVVTKSAFDEFVTKINKKCEEIDAKKKESGRINKTFGTDSRAERFFDFLASGPLTKTNMNIEKKDMSVATNASGGYLVPHEYSNDLHEVIKQSGVARNLHDVIELSQGKDLDFPVVDSDNDDGAYFQVSEGTTISDEDLVTGRVVVTPAEVVGAIVTSNKLIRQSRVSVAEIVMRGLGQRAARLEDRVVFAGTGTNNADNGGIYGYAHSPNVAEVAVANSSLNLDILANLMNTVPNEVYENDDSAFYMSRGTYTQLLLQKIDSKTNSYGLGQPSSITLDANGRPTIYGKRIVLISALPTYFAGDAADSSSDVSEAPIDGYILYGNLREAGKIVTLGNYAVEASPHVKFLNAQTVWRVNYDFGFNVPGYGHVARARIY